MTFKKFGMKNTETVQFNNFESFTQISLRLTMLA